MARDIDQQLESIRRITSISADVASRFNSPLLEANRQLTERLKPITSLSTNVTPRLNDQFLELNNRLAEQIRPYTEAMEQFRNAYRPIFYGLDFSTLIPEGVADYLKQIEELEKTDDSDFLLLSRNGWFPDFTSLGIPGALDQVETYRHTYDNEGRQKADLEITQHFETAMDRFLEEAGSYLAEERVKIVQDAIHAHKHGLYTLSSPIFLIQTDGHAAYAYNAPVWGAPKRSMLQIAETEYQNGKFLGEALLPFFRQNQPMVANKGQREKTPPLKHIINRHMVLHGESLDYGTRENSARAFSFMWYCMFFMDCFFEEQSEEQDSEG
ncbi:hypothetical protein TW86_18045 [Halomonas sp. S2151]|uniref:hypothetical protein n=1 Tax=Halomonas sp. S2151 TaxID=579478 RepID=UPI0005FA4AA8|nr:hypothetical protein [Halomonas sp. S2151]KJZ07159.1 hypothetical protein TW86_18045 [Halomonas sp. S2151]